MTGHKISIVLVSPLGEANIGATARAMKNFGLDDLRLVDCVPHQTKAAYMWAVDARDVLDSAERFKTLSDALADVSYSVAFTRRMGKNRKKQLEIKEAMKLIATRAQKGGVALVFGREDKGLANKDVNCCDVIVSIPTSSKLASLNLSQAVLIACHKIFCLTEKEKGERKGLKPGHGQKQEFVSRGEISNIMMRLEAMLERLDYADTPSNTLKSKIIRQIERIFGRAGLTPRDLKMIEGLIARIMGRIEK